MKIPLGNLGSFFVICFLVSLFSCDKGSTEPENTNIKVDTPILASAANFRDLAGISESNGGSGFVNTSSDGGIMRLGVFYRSNPLNDLSEADWQTISGLNIYRIIDLRTPDEIDGAEDSIPTGTLWTNINIYGTQGPVPSPFWGSPSEAIAFMETGYRYFVTDSVQCAAIRNVLLTLANDPGPVLWHCSGGKDRTGWIAALLQSIAGIESEIIMQDYLATNTYTSDLIESTKIYLQGKYPDWNTETMDALLGVKASYLEAGFTQINSTYGTMTEYLTQGIGISAEDIDALRVKMLRFPD
jgi:protein-tyrosine phosphatase